MKTYTLKRYLALLFCCLLIFEGGTAAQSGDDLLRGMSLEHKVGQMFMVNLYGAGLTDAGREMLQTWQPGAVLLMDSNTSSPPQQITRLINSYQQTITEAGGVPLFVATDQEGGIVARLKDGFSVWPVPMLLTAAQDPVLAAAVGQGKARELRAVGVNMNLAPVADLQTNLANPIIGRRSPGSDPQMVGSTLAALVEGMQSAGVMATAKHFPGHGDTAEDSHTTLPELPHDMTRLEAVELPPFRAVIEAEVGAVMVAHIWFSALDPDETIPSSLSYNVVTGLLRDQLGYDGIVMTDAMDMDAIDTRYSAEEAAVKAVQAGIDLIAIGANAGEGVQRRAMQAVVDAVSSGEIDESRIDESVRRILRAKDRFGVLDWVPLPPDSVSERMDTAASAELIAEVFRAGTTLARDNSGLLPVESSDRVGIIFPGTRYGIQRECGLHLPDARWLAITNRPDTDEVRAATDFASRLDTVIVFTQDAYYNENQQSLVQALPAEQIVIVAMESPYDLLRFPQVGAYVVTYSPLDPAITAACELVAGVRPPTGKLSVNLDGVLPTGTSVGGTTD